MLTAPKSDMGISPALLAIVPRSRAWSPEPPTAPGWYWLRHAAFRTTAGAWREVHPMIVELVRDGTGPMMLFVSGSEWVRSLEDLVVGEWIGPLEVPS